MEIKKAKRHARPAIINMWGLSGSGKTYGALTLAKGMIAEGEKIGLIDTENGRASYYANLFDFDVLELEPPFTPERYLEAIKAFDEKNYKVIIVDSLSHEWEGSGGCLDIQENQLNRRGQKLQGNAAWRIPKKRHKKLMYGILYSVKAHIILCSRGKAQQKEVNGEYVDMGVVPIQEKGISLIV